MQLNLQRLTIPKSSSQGHAGSFPSTTFRRTHSKSKGLWYHFHKGYYYIKFLKKTHMQVYLFYGIMLEE